MYNVTPLKNVTDVMVLADYANTITNNTFFGVLLIGLFFVFLFALKKQGIETGLMIASFLCLILSVMLNFINFVSFYYTLAFFILAGLTTLYSYVVRPGQ